MLRTIANVLALLAVGVLVPDLIGLVSEGEWTPLAFGELWFRIHPGSLQLLQPAIERYLHPGLWDPFIQTALVGPAFAVPAVLAAVFYVLAWTFRARKRRTLLD
ncbi:MAG: hypothetical protein AAFT19_02005 [Pseudomonadota bacterium]